MEKVLTKRLFSVFLSLIMVLTMVPEAAFAGNVAEVSVKVPLKAELANNSEIASEFDLQYTLLAVTSGAPMPSVNTATLHFDDAPRLEALPGIMMTP